MEKKLDPHKSSINIVTVPSSQKKNIPTVNEILNLGSEKKTYPYYEEKKPNISKTKSNK
jgi:hypothetical protein